MKALDLFCGLGGWSNGLVLEGFQMLGVEINPNIAKLYEHPVICADIELITDFSFPKYDLVVGSPPCRDFTRLPDKYWKEKKDPKRGLRLVTAFLNIVKKIKPTYWLMENVSNLALYIGKPVCWARLSKGMVRGFWGNFPVFFIPGSNKKNIQDVSGRYRSWLRAKIPIGVSCALGRAVKTDLANRRKINE